jgi:hypothetical protein
VQRLRGCGPPDGGYSVVKVQVGGKVLPYIRTFTPPKVKALFKIPFTYSEVRRGKSQPWVRENFYPLTNSEFQTPICKPWEVKFPIFNCLKKNPSIYPDI